MKYLAVKLLISVLTITFLISCDSEEPIPQDFLPTINGGHQASAEDNDLVFYYGLFNVEGEASNSFKKGEEIYFSFWVENKRDIGYSFTRPVDSKFMQVFQKEGVDNNVELIGTPFGEFCQQDGRKWEIEQNLILKALPFTWYSFGPSFYCQTIEGEPLEVGDYYTSIIKTFEYFDSEYNRHLTDEITLSVDFEIID